VTAPSPRSEPATCTPLGWIGTSLGILAVIGLVLWPRPTLWLLLLVSFQALCLILIELAGRPRR
jgi:hypothetical protein